MLEEDTFNAMEKSVVGDADMTKVFAKKVVVLKRSCDETKKEIEVLEQTLLGQEVKRPNCKPLRYIIKDIVIYIIF